MPWQVSPAPTIAYVGNRDEAGNVDQNPQRKRDGLFEVSITVQKVGVHRMLLLGSD